MATASTEEVVIVPAVEAVVEKRVTLTMTEKEAQTLVAALRKISGPVKESRGLLTDDILPALEAQVGKWDFDYRVQGMHIGAGATFTRPHYL